MPDIEGWKKKCFYRGVTEMRNLKKSAVVVTFALLLIAPSAFGQPELRTLKTKIVDTLAKFPAGDATERDKLASEIVLLGPEGIQEVCRMLVPPGTGDDSQVRFALNGVAVYVSRRGGPEAEREMFARALIESLDEAKDNEVKAFLISQLQVAGKKESVKPLSRFLKDKRLCEPATQALLAIYTPDAEKALLKSLGSARDTNRITIVKALGEMKSRAASKKIIKYAESRDENLRRVALYALASIGDPDSERVLDKVLITASPYDRIIAPSLYLLYAERLAESGKKEHCLRICRKMIENYTSPQESQIQCTALSILAEAMGEDCFDDLLAIMGNPNKELRLRALELSKAIKAEEATARWVERMAGVSPEVQAEIIFMLGQRGDKTAFPIILKKLKEEDKVIRLAAIPAAARLGGIEVLQDLMDILRKGQAEEVNAVKQALMGFSGSQVIPEAVRVLKEMPSLARAALIEILSERQAKEHADLVFAQAASESQEVRLASLAGLENLVTENDLPRLIELLLKATDYGEISLIQNAAVASANQIPELEKRADLFLEALGKASGSKRVDLLRPLARIGGERALQTVIQETKSEDLMIQDAAVKTLAEWPDMSAAGELLNICRSTSNSENLRSAIQGYVRLVNEADLAPDKKFTFLKDALEIPLEAEEKSFVLFGLSNIKTIDSLKFVANYLGDIDLKGKASLAAARIAYPGPGQDFGLFGSDVISVLKKAAAIIEDSYEKERLEKYIEALLKKEGFVQLFNGKDLSGWKGLVGDPVSRVKMTPEELKEAQERADSIMREHWKVVDGILVFDGKGESLCTARDCGDFELFVDWKIEEKGDSGIYLRGSPQVQIWDPAQWPEGSGGLYNNQKGPNKPLKCADNPIGEWNTFWVKMIGERVTVYLNNVLVVDDIVLENYWERDKPIYSSGQIELQAHNTPLYFRNIFIREITAEKMLQGLKLILYFCFNLLGSIPSCVSEGHLESQYKGLSGMAEATIEGLAFLSRP